MEVEHEILGNCGNLFFFPLKNARTGATNLPPWGAENKHTLQGFFLLLFFFKHY